MQVTLKKINNESVPKIKIPEPVENILGGNIFSLQHCNILNCGRTGSGKSTIIAKILKACCDKNTKVIIFSRSHNNDKIYEEIKRDLKSRDITFEAHDSIYDDDGQNMIDKWVKEANNTREEDKPIKIKHIDRKTGECELLDLPEKKKQKSPELFIIFDDITGEIKDPAVKSLCNMSRHFRSKIMLTCHALNDIQPDTKLQCDYLLIIGNHPIHLLEKIHKESALNCNFDRSEERRVGKECRSRWSPYH